LLPFALSHPPRRANYGFTLVEIMVGMVIGVLGLIIMMQVFSLSESQKRTTTGGGDAQSSGAIALFGLQRDIRQAGYGASDVKLLGCSLLLRAGVTLASIAPLTINSASITGQDANTDTLLAVYANTNGSPQGDGIVSQPASGGTAVLPDIYAVQTPTSFNSGDRVIATPQNRATPCNLSVTTVAGVGDPPWGSSANVVVTTGTGVAGMSNGTLFNLGRTPRILAYAIRSGNLTQCDYMVNDCGNAANNSNSAIWVPISNNIVSLKAEYGRDTSATMDAIPDIYDTTGPTTACGWARVPALRLALVARNANFEKTAVTATAPAWDGDTTSNPAAVAANNIDLSANATWQNYRYRVLQTLVPLRNLVWQGVPSGC
jgi:type IV pilus assembly protein PilW